MIKLLIDEFFKRYSIGPKEPPSLQHSFEESLTDFVGNAAGRNQLICLRDTRVSRK